MPSAQVIEIGLYSLTDSGEGNLGMGVTVHSRHASGIVRVVIMELNRQVSGMTKPEERVLIRNGEK